MKYAILVINPIYANEIKKGNKKWEFRKIKLKEYNYIYLYETKPISKCTILVKCNQYLEDTPENIWEKCKDDASITKDNFFSYFKNRKKAYAYRIDSFELIDIDIKKYNIKLNQCVNYIDKIE